MTMRTEPDPDRERLARLFAEAIERPAGERQQFLDEACRDAPALRAEAESLLAAHDAAGGFLDDPDTTWGERALEEPPPERAGPYRLEREVGRGGMGVVWLAERVEGGFRQRAAVKLLKRGMDSDAILRRFLRERQILAGLAHENVARLLDGGVTADGRPYFAMEYVEGLPLTAYCETNGLGLEDRLRLFEEACRAVQYAHGKLIVHRDLKPSNMLVTAGGHLKLLDFGIAKLLAEEEGATALTQDGTRVLTPEYAAPEQVRGEPVTTATDVYALGVVLYELLTGASPYGDKPRTVGEMVHAVCEVEPRPPSAAAAATPRLARRLRGDLDTLALKALAKEPARRYASAEALADDVRRHLTGHPVQARRDTVAYVAARFVRRHKVGVGAAVLLVLSLVLGLAGTAWQGALAARQRDRAQAEAERAEKVKEFLIGLFQASDPSVSQGETVTARELLDRGTARIETELAGHPSLQADLFGAVANISQSLGRYDRARTLAERAVERTRQAYGTEDPRVAEALDTLGWILHSSGDYAAAEGVAREALALRRRRLPSDSPDLATSLELLGVVLREQAKLDEAERLHRESLAIRRRVLGPEQPRTALSLSNLGNVLYMKGDYAAAAEHQREVVRIQRKALGARHASVATSLLSLGAALRQDGDLSAAEAAQREALDIRRQLYGAEHPWISEATYHLAATVHEKGGLREAEALYRQALAMDRKLKGEEHRDVGVVSANLGQALAQQARFDEAMRAFAESEAVLRRAVGPDHPLVARTLERTAVALLDQGRARDALPLIEQVLGVYTARYGARHPTVATATAAAARARSLLGERDAAEALFREALDLQRQVRPKPHATTVEILLAFGEALTSWNRAADAEPLLREALSQAEASLPAGHFRRGQVERALGAARGRVSAAR